MSDADKAAEITDRVQERVARTMERLDQDFTGRIIDGRGVYADKPRQRSALSFAIAELTAARELLDTTPWPAV